jgi:hypothetical protein
VRKRSYALFASALLPNSVYALASCKCACANGIHAYDTAMIENILELRRRLRIPVRGNERLTAHISRVQTAEIELRKV